MHGFIKPDAFLQIQAHARKRGRVPDEVGADCLTQLLSGPCDVLEATPEQIEILLRHRRAVSRSPSEPLTGPDVVAQLEAAAAA